MENKTSSYKNIIIFLVIFAITGILTTILLANSIIKNRKNNNQDYIIQDVNFGEVNKPSKDEEDINKQYIVNDLNEYYALNNLDFKEIEYQEKNQEEPNKNILDIVYFEIDGLKNEEIEKQINAEIKREALDNNLEYGDTMLSKIVRYDITGSFSNILSFSITTYWNDKNDNNGGSYYYDTQGWYSNHERKCFNYNLVTGEQIKLTDVMLSLQPIKEQINIEAEKQYQWDEPVEEWEIYNYEYIQYVNKQLDGNYDKYIDLYWDGELEKDEIQEAVEAGKIMDMDTWKAWYYRSNREEKKLKLIQDLEKGKYGFSIANNFIMVYVEDISAKVYLLPYIKYITLYKKYMTEESIFTNEYNNEKKYQYKYFESNDKKYGNEKENIKLGYIEENIFLDYSIFNSDTIGSKMVMSIFEEKVDAMREYWKHDKENVFLIKVNFVGGYLYEYFALQISKNDFENQKENILKKFIYTETGTYGAVDGPSISTETFESLGIKYEFYHSYLHIWEDENEIIDMYYDRENLDTKAVEEYMLRWNIESLERCYNEIFAYHGHDFKTKSLRDYFLGKIWYKPIRNKVVSIDELSELENQNRITLKNQIDKLKNP